MSRDETIRNKDSRNSPIFERSGMAPAAGTFGLTLPDAQHLPPRRNERRPRPRFIHRRLHRKPNAPRAHVANDRRAWSFEAFAEIQSSFVQFRSDAANLHMVALADPYQRRALGRPCSALNPTLRLPHPGQDLDRFSIRTRPWQSRSTDPPEPAA